MRSICIALFLAVTAIRVCAQAIPEVYTRLEESYFKDDFEACIRLTGDVEQLNAGRVDTLASNSFFYIGDAYNQLGETDKAIHYFERSRSVLERSGLGQTEEFSSTLSNLAYLYLLAGNYSSAGKTAEELIALDRRLYAPTDPEWIESVLSVTDIYLQLDRIAIAERHLLQTLKQQEKASHNRGLVLNKLGELYSYSGEYRRASGALHEALGIHWDTSGEESAEYINAAINLGILYMNQGKYPEAEEIFEAALSKVDPADPAYAPLLNNQSLVLHSLGQLERAERILQHIRTLDSLAVGADHPDFAITLSNLGLVYADHGKLDQAKQTLQRALAIQGATGEAGSISYARKLNNLAKVYGAAGEPEKAAEYLKTSLSIFRKNMGKRSPEYATAAYNLGVALSRTGRRSEALRYLRISAEIRARVLGKRHPKYAESIQQIGEMYWEQNAIGKARALFSEVFDSHYFQIDETFPVLTEEEKAKFFYANVRPAIDKFNAFAAMHHHGQPGLLAEVFNGIINTKAAIMYATEKVRSSILSSGDTVLIGQFEAWQAAKEQIARQHGINQSIQGLDSLLAIADALEKALARKSTDFQLQLVRERVDLREIQHKLQPGDAAVEVLRYRNYDPKKGGQFTGDISYAFLLITRESGIDPIIIPLDGGQALEKKFLAYYRNNIRFKLDDAASYVNYFAPLARHLDSLNISRVFISPDGVYNQINIGSLRNPVTKRYAIDEFDIRIVTNTREIAEANTKRENTRIPALIGYPKFNLEARELRPSGARSIRSATNRSWRSGLMRLVRGEQGITELPGTEVELRKISGLFKDGAPVYMQANATEEIARSIDNPAILHFATHGYFLEDETRGGNQTYYSNPLLNAGLILAGAENFLKTGEPLNESGDDGILTAYEAMNLRLDNTRLVILSACETALGVVSNGEGVYGLQRAFKVAGSQSIVMSLWTVDDEATQYLMTAFYEKLLQSGDQHEAFRLAQIAVREKYAAPFYWGAFIMVGI